ncbi:probable pectinesterase/pectinesterase inhibitor 25 [Argentina anserina]|uniref:probable pectinesterase/pectinesterase inhibitor 25 n=1 Tax=Argentina anserina TaxID=57926 RepID=UPI002176627A|nr:probable pectinesterase/pectinesterase inhibitor 25 [Potentilla anserina]
MPTLPPSSSLLLLLVVPLLFCFAAEAESLPSPSSSASAACKYTLYPKLCRSILSTIGSSPSDPYNYGKFSINQCLKKARKVSKALDRPKRYSSMTNAEVNAFKDCQQLSELNVDYLEAIGTELKSAELLNEELVGKVQTLLSGIVTNQQTCFDGLVVAKSSIVNSSTSPLSVAFSNTTQLYSVSLGLVTHSLARNLKKHKKRKGFVSHGHKIREPLETFIEGLRKGSSKRSRDERILDEMESSGIIVYDAVIVSQHGSDNFTSIGAAIDSAPNNTKPEDGYFVIYARKGRYKEYVVIPKYKKNIMLLGDGINKTIITGKHNFVDGWTTFNSSTFAVSGERFVAIDVTFKNTAGPEKHQAVAVRNNADFSTFYRCSFEGYQDTLYAHSLRQFYKECDIYGTVDFIFGNAAAVFQSCNLYARKPMPNQKNAFTAQGRTDPNQNTGISIHNCTIEAAPDLAMDLNSTLNFLGRPWKVYSRTVIMQSYIGPLISSVGWLEWNGTVGLDTLYYGEFENHGPGANTSSRVQWPGYSLMNATQALNFTVTNFTLGDTWLPYTDIPFFAGLIGN